MLINIKKEKMKKLIRKTAIVLLWLILWQLFACWVNNSVLFASPLDTVKALGMLVVEVDFFKTLLVSLGKVTIGFLLGLLTGAVLGTFGAKKDWVDDLLRPVLSFMKSVPVAAFVVLLLIWWGSRWLSVAIVFVVVFPYIYFAFCEGLKQVDCYMLEVAKVYQMPRKNQWYYLYRRALKPFMDNALKLSFGLAWKSGVAAEVIGTPNCSIGEGLYMAKTHLNTPEVFAWIVVILLLSTLYEKAGMLVWMRFCHWKPKCKGPVFREKVDKGFTEGTWVISKSFGDKEVWKKQEIQLSAGQIYTLQAPSGRGKTTMLRILAGLEANEEASAKSNQQTEKSTILCSMVFQEDRLLLEETPLVNIEMVLGSCRRQEIWENLLEVIPELETQQTCQMLSGGMRRRVCLVRAMLSHAELILLDEPFTGVDEQTKQQMAEYILSMQQGRTIVVVTHQEKDAKMLNSTHFKL